MMEAPRKSKLIIDLFPGVTRPPTEAAKRHQKPGLTSSVRLAQPILYCVILRAVVPRLKARVRREVSGLVSAAEIARVVKANSSHWVREKHSAEFAWQAGYGVFSVSESSVADVTKYISGQEEHHKKRSFQEEFVAFLKKNRVEYDPRYIWD